MSHLLSRLLFENLSDGLQAEPFKVSIEYGISVRVYSRKLFMGLE